MVFFYKDLYPNQGKETTSSEVIPEADDQRALADDQKAAQSTMTSIKTPKNKIIGAIILLIAITAGMGVIKK